MSKNSDAMSALLEKHFDIAFAAPNGIKKLRELILSLAMQGKLVAQDPSDQPASELLKEIEAQKERLIKEGKFKKPKPLPEIKPDEVPYDLPKSWKWVRLGNISQIIGGFAYKSNIFKMEGTKQVLRLGNIRPDLLRLNENPVFIDDSIGELTSEYCLLKNDILITMTGTRAKRDYLYTVRIEENPINDVSLYLNQRVGAIRLFFESRYINIALKVEVLKDVIFLSATGSANQANIGINNLREWVLPLPPLAEQRRIVAKIDELMARCDELEKLRGDRDRKQITVHNSALNRLLIAKQQSEFNTAWQFITQHFSELYSVKENVTELRKAILQLAIMGKLVPQDPNDQPASELLKEIEKEKERLVKEGKIKKSKPLPEIKPDEIPYELPNSWKWVRFGHLFRVTSGNNLTKDKMIEGDFPVYGGNGITGYHSKFNTEKPTIVIGRVGYYCGSIHLTPERAWITDNAFVTIYNEEKLYQKFVIWLLKTINLQVDTSATAQPVISGGKIYPILIPLPPLEEQHRIVAKIDQLMALCDNLEKQIDHANSKQTTLLNAVVTKV